MSVDFISTNKEIIERNGFIISSIQEQYQMASFAFVGNGNLKGYNSPNARDGFGGATVKSFTPTLQTPAMPSVISALTNVFNTAKATHTAHVFEMKPLVLRYDVSKQDDAADQTNVYGEILKSMRVWLDTETMPILVENIDPGSDSFITTAAGISIGEINEAAGRAFDSLKNNLEISIGSGLTIYVDDNVNAFLRKPTQNEQSTLRSVFIQALEGNMFGVFNNQVSKSIKQQLVKNGTTFEDNDGLILIGYTPNIRLHHGFLPQLYGQIATPDLTIANHFATNNISFEIFKESVVAIKVTA